MNLWSIYNCWGDKRPDIEKVISLISYNDRVDNVISSFQL
ncbi:12742_t:CDS:2 [Funneliformis mosseae]|uniref:12742_t:CDS:1 n=1 Tax=Funneliformis mosseae TaxID=27381 RepID=A0A9N8V6N3_FUNMO|nr:12742_t:CDS:2 [Funneliformis mosseae]